MPQGAVCSQHLERGGAQDASHFAQELEARLDGQEQQSFANQRCVWGRGDPKISQIEAREPSRPARALEYYESVVASDTNSPAASRARLGMARVLQTIAPQRALTCARQAASGLDPNARRMGAALSQQLAEQVVGPAASCDSPGAEATQTVESLEQTLIAKEAATRRQAAPKPDVSGEGRSSGNCHWVSGYTRKNGTQVRGHMRCR
jgi:hypothetical protein